MTEHTISGDFTSILGEARAVVFGEARGFGSETERACGDTTNGNCLVVVAIEHQHRSTKIIQ